MSRAEEEQRTRQRIDKWLWHARIVRTRSAGSALVTSGHVRVNGRRIDAPSRTVRAGDIVTIAFERGVRVFKVRAFAERRGPPQQGRKLCELLDPAAELSRASSARTDG